MFNRNNVPMYHYFNICNVMASLGWFFYSCKCDMSNHSSLLTLVRAVCVYLCYPMVNTLIRKESSKQSYIIF